MSYQQTLSVAPQRKPTKRKENASVYGGYVPVLGEGKGKLYLVCAEYWKKIRLVESSLQVICNTFCTTWPSSVQGSKKDRSQSKEYFELEGIS
jgi:hypothetical protein